DVVRELGQLYCDGLQYLPRLRLDLRPAGVEKHAVGEVNHDAALGGFDRDHIVQVVAFLQRPQRVEEAAGRLVGHQTALVDLTERGFPAAYHRIIRDGHPAVQDAQRPLKRKDQRLETGGIEGRIGEEHDEEGQKEGDHVPVGVEPGGGD